MDFEALIRKHVGEDGKVDVDKLATAISSAVGREFVDKKRYNDKLNEIETIKAEKQTAEDDAAANAAWKQKHDALKKTFDEYKADVASKATLASVKAAHRKLLADEKIDAADIDLIMAGTDYSGMKLDDKGELTDAESIKADIKKKYARYIPEVKSKGDNPATPPESDAGGIDANAIRAMTAKWHADRYGAAPKTE